jgi:copper(I)-binding protein
MANIAAVLKQMPWEERSLIRVVFVTTDPERDTPQRLKEWLGNFDASFVGLTGSKEELARLQKSLGLREPQREIANGDSVNYFVGHAAQVFAFARDGLAYLIYPFGIRQEDWANDLPQLARDSSGAEVRRQGAAAARSNPSPAGSSADIPSAASGLSVTQAVIAEPPTQSEAALYLTIRNDTPQEDTLVAVAAEDAVRAELHEPMGTGSMRGMQPVRAIAVPPGTDTRLVPGGRHVMLMSLRRTLAAGDSATLYLSFARGGAVHARARVVKYSDLEKVLETRP